MFVSIHSVFRLAAALELGLVALEKCFTSLTFLPLGGGPLQQIAICFIVAFLYAEITAVRKDPPD